MQKYIQSEEGRCMRSIKRILGTSLMSVGTTINGKLIKFDEILGFFLKNIKNKLDLNADEDIKNVVIGRPVHFQINNKQSDIIAENELRNIAQSVGFENIEFQFEPIAAAFAHESTIDNEQLAFVIDIGGGTSDFSVIRIGKNLMNKANRSDDILASTGVRIGGNDFDKNLSIKSFMPEFGMGTTFGGQTKFDKELPVPNSHYFEMSEWSSINNLYNYKNKKEIETILAKSNSYKKYERLSEIVENEKIHELLSQIEQTKIDLTSKDNIETKLLFMPDKPTIKTSKKEFEKSINENIDTISKSIKQCLKDAKISNNDIDLIILTGGSTEIPHIKKSLCSHFPNAKISEENKLSSVATGLAFDAIRRL